MLCVLVCQATYIHDGTVTVYWITIYMYCTVLHGWYNVCTWIHKQQWVIECNGWVDCDMHGTVNTYDVYTVYMGMTNSYVNMMDRTCSCKQVVQLRYKHQSVPLNLPLVPSSFAISMAHLYYHLDYPIAAYLCV